MNPYNAYRQQSESPSAWTRIDVLLALFDKGILRLEQAHQALTAGDRAGALGLLCKAQLAVMSLASCIDPASPQGVDMLRLYEFATHAMSLATADDVLAARNVLGTLRQGFRSIRAEAADLERRGALPAASETLQLVQATA
jgi:flagellin-specific chaperone FliS